MPAKTGRRAKPARLLLRRRAGREPVWVILDRGREQSTGCSAQDRAGADAALEAYLADKYAPPTGPRPLAALLIADVINVYLREHAPHVAAPSFLAATALPILDWWTGRTLADIRGATCRDYVAWRTKAVSEATARHDLKTLRAAIRYYHAEHGPLPAVPDVTLPPKPEPRTRWLTRAEAARMIRAARARQESRHVARFVLMGIYTGTRSAAILGLRWLPSTSSGHVDTDAGIIHRRAPGSRTTAKRQPPVRVPDRLRAHLRRWRRLDAAHGITWVVHYQGAPIAKMRRSWATARTAAGLGADVVPHSMRHTAATWLMLAGVPMAEAAAFLGMSVATLEEIYGHHHPEFQARAAAHLSRRRP